MQIASERAKGESAQAGEGQALKSAEEAGGDPQKGTRGGRRRRRLWTKADAGVLRAQLKAQNFSSKTGKAQEHTLSWYERFKVRKLARARAEKLAVIASRGGACMDCGGSFRPECYHFDHRPGTKKYRNVGLLFGTAAPGVLADELAKCDMVCANCHATRTVIRGAGRPRPGKLRVTEAEFQKLQEGVA